jgi:Flp pilus assembly protein TadB
VADEERVHLPPRLPRPFVVHWGVDAAVAFLLIVVVALFAGLSIWVVVGAALVIGLVAAPCTRRAERRALAAQGRLADAGNTP